MDEGESLREKETTGLRSPHSIDPQPGHVSRVCGNRVFSPPSLFEEAELGGGFVVYAAADFARETKKMDVSLFFFCFRAPKRESGLLGLGRGGI